MSERSRGVDRINLSKEGSAQLLSLEEIVDVVYRLKCM